MNYLEQRRQWKQFGKPKEEKKFNRIAPKGKKKLAQEQQDRESGKDATEDKWFEDRGKELTGRCLFCGGETEKAKPKEFYLRMSDDPEVAEGIYIKAMFRQRCSVAHLFAKRKNMFPSIKLHPENFIELCFFQNSCHTNFDNHIITFEDIKNNFPDAWKEIVRKTIILYPAMTEKEKNKVPQILINEIKIQS